MRCNLNHILFFENAPDTAGYGFRKFFQVRSLGFSRDSVIVLVRIVTQLVSVDLNWTFVSGVDVVGLGGRPLDLASGIVDATVELSIQMMVAEGESCTVVSLVLKVDGSYVLDLHATWG